MVYLVLAVLFLHILSLSITFGGEVFVDSDTGEVAIAARVFGIKIYTKRTSFGEIKARLPKAADDGKDVVKKAKKNKTFLKAFALALLKRLRIRYINVVATIGTGDAATTAAAVGTSRIAAATACAAGGYRGDIGVISPDFDNECIKVDFAGIFSLCFADIIYAVCAAVRKSATERVKRRRVYANNVAE